MARAFSRGNLTRGVTILVVLAVVAGVAAYVLLGQPGTRKLSVDVASGVGIYPGTPVEILGIQVGKVTKVEPRPTAVHLELEYGDEYHLPANVGVVVVANSLVSDRYLQLSPVYTSGPVLADGATIPMTRTSAPAELDDIYAALNNLSVQLGPNGTNKNGALSTLLKVAAANLGGNGEQLGQSVQAVSQAVQTLANNRDNLFATVSNLQTLNVALNQSQQNIEHFEQMLAQVSGDLAAERSDLGAALHNLSVALAQVSSFVHDNADGLHTDISGLKDVTGVLAKDKGALDEILAVAPVALANLVHAYQENTGTLGTRSNLTLGLQDPAKLCGFFDAVGLVTNSLLGPISQTVADYCAGIAKQVTIPVFPSSVQNRLKNVLPAIPGAS